MANNQVKYDYKQILASAILVVVAATAFYFYWDITKLIIRKMLEAEFITIFIPWAVIISIFTLHYFKHRNKDVESDPIITKKYGTFIDYFSGLIGYGTTITTSLTLLKGLYIQKFFPNDKIYFLEFNTIDLMTMFGVTLFLLYFSFMKVIDIAKETYKIEHTEQVLNEQRVVVIPDDRISNN